MSDFTADRLELLESETHGSLALGSQTTVSGWTVTTLPSGEFIHCGLCVALKQPQPN